MANQNTVLQSTELFEELSDADLMAVVGGSNSGVLQSTEAGVLALQNILLGFQYDVVKNTTDQLGTDGQ